MTNEIRNPQLSARDFLYVIFKRKYTILGFGLTFCITVYAILSIMTPRYLVNLTIYVEPGGKMRANISQRESSAVLRESVEEINSEVEIIRSRPVLEKVTREYPDIKDILNRDPSTFRRTVKYVIRIPLSELKRLWREGLYISGLKSRPSPEELAFIDLESSIEMLRTKKFFKIEPVRNSNIIELKLYAANPDKAVPILDDLVRNYILHRLKVDQLPKARNFFDEQMVLSKNKLDKYRNKLSDYQENLGLISYKKQEELLLDKYSKFDGAYTTVNKDIVSKEARLMKMKELLKVNKGIIIPSLEIIEMPSIKKLYSKLVELKVTRASLSIKYKPEDWLMQNNISEMREIKKELKEEVISTIQLHENSLATLKAERKALEETLVKLKEEIKQLPDLRDEIMKFDRDVVEEENMLSLLTKKRDEERISAAKDTRIVNLKIVSPASFNSRPAKPKKKLYLLIALIAAFFGSFSLIYTLEYLDHTIKSSEDVSQYIGLPILGSVPEVR